MSTAVKVGKRRVAPDVMGGFGKGLAVIEAFDREHEQLTIAEAARLTGLDRATARRCLRTLVERGFATLEGTHYSLTARILRLGYAYLAAAPLPRLVQPYLERLSAATQESCSVCVLDGAEIVYVARASQRRVMSVGLSVGSRLPAFCTSMGRVLLASLPDAEARTVLGLAPRPKLTAHTRTGLAEVLEAISSARARGYALVDQELELGLRSIAVPLRGRVGVVGAVNVGAQAGRVSMKEMKDTMLPALQQLAAELEMHL
jgi:IclR family transcriptional regulator, pca regulon regulatory protein